MRLFFEVDRSVADALLPRLDLSGLAAYNPGMSELAHDYNKTSSIDIEVGFEKLLELPLPVSKALELVQEPVQEPVQELSESLESYWTTDDAAKKLGVSQRTIFKRLKDGTLQGVRVKGKFRQEWRIQPLHVLSPVEVDCAEQEGNFLNGPVLNHQAQEVLQDSSVTSSRSDNNSDLDKLLDVIREKDQLLQAATFRNGYLQAQLEGKDNEIKLLTDSQQKKSWWKKIKESFYKQ